MGQDDNYGKWTRNLNLVAGRNFTLVPRSVPFSRYGKLHQRYSWLGSRQQHESRRRQGSKNNYKDKGHQWKWVPKRLPRADESIVGSVIETGNGTGSRAETTMASNRIMVGTMRCDVQQGSVLIAASRIECEQKQMSGVVGPSGKHVERAKMDRTLFGDKKQAVQSHVILCRPETIQTQELVDAKHLDNKCPRFGAAFKCDLTSFSDWEHEARAEIIMNHRVIGPELTPRFDSSGCMSDDRMKNSTRRVPHYFAEKDMMPSIFVDVRHSLRKWDVWGFGVGSQGRTQGQVLGVSAACWGGGANMLSLSQLALSQQLNGVLQVSLAPRRGGCSDYEHLRSEESKLIGEALNGSIS
jgi:hypothetical protein